MQIFSFQCNFIPFQLRNKGFVVLLPDCQSILPVEMPHDQEGWEAVRKQPKTAKQGWAGENTSKGPVPSGGGWGRPKAQPRRAHKQEIRETDGAVRQREGRVQIWWAKQTGTIVPKPKKLFYRKDYRLKLASKLFGVLKSLHSGVPLRDLEAQLPFLEIMESGGYFCH